MPLPKIIFREISDLANLAAKLDQFILNARNDDDSYGSMDKISAQITLSLSVLQCHAKKGLSLDSPRLSGLYCWLKQMAVDSPGILTAPLRLAAAAVVSERRESVEKEIRCTIHLLKDWCEGPTIEKPIIFMLSLEALQRFDFNFSSNELIKDAFVKLTEILNSTAKNLSIPSYAAMLLFLYGTENQKKEAEKKWKEIIRLYNNPSWCQCVVEIAYVALNALQCVKYLPELKDTIDYSIEFLRGGCPKGVPRDELIKFAPTDLGDDTSAKKIYAASVATQAIVEYLGPNKCGCLEFAHAAWNLENKKLEAEIKSLKGDISDLRREKDKEKEYFNKRKTNYITWIIALALMLTIALILLLDSHEIVAYLLGGITIIGFIIDRIKECKNGFRFFSN